jgi:hypothetical protein
MKKIAILILTILLVACGQQPNQPNSVLDIERQKSLSGFIDGMYENIRAARLGKITMQKAEDKYFSANSKSDTFLILGDWATEDLQNLTAEVQYLNFSKIDDSTFRVSVDVFEHFYLKGKPYVEGNPDSGGTSSLDFLVQETRPNQYRIIQINNFPQGRNPEEELGGGGVDPTKSDSGARPLSVNNNYVYDRAGGVVRLSHPKPQEA